MTLRHPQFRNYLDDQAGAPQRFRFQQHIPDRLNEHAAIITVVVLLVAILLKFHDIDVSVDAIAYAFLLYLWHFLVYLTPGRFLFAMDKLLNPSSMSASPPRTHAAKSEVMQRVLGLNRTGGMMKSVFQARSRALSVTGNVLGLRLDFARPAGLGNRDNSCYQNSILQGLASLPSFHRYLSACVQTIDAQQKTVDVAHTLRTLITDLNDVSNNGRTIWTPPLLKSMSTWTQQDAQEYFSKILDDIDRSVAKAVRSARQRSGFETDNGRDGMASSQHSDDSGYQSVSSDAQLLAKKTLRNPLEGLLAQRVACIQCGYSEGLSMIPFNCLTLSLGLDKHQHDLYERLDAYSRVEAIEGVECPKCTLLKAQKLLTKLVERLTESGSLPEKIKEPLRRLEAVELALEEDHFDEETIGEECKISSQGKVSTTKTKQIVIARPPQSLAIHVNRSVFDPRTFAMMKNSAPLSFPHTLDLGPWCLGSAEDGSMERVLGDMGSSEERWQLDAKSSMVAGDLKPSRLSGPLYELRAAVTHYGRHENGHYICYRRYPECEGSIEAQNPSAPLHDEIKEEEQDDDDDDDDESGPAQEEENKNQVQPPPGTRNQGWWRLSDDNVSEVDEEVVSSLSPGVFMLFYECVDPAMVLQGEQEQDEMEDTMSHQEDASDADDACTPGPRHASRAASETEDACSSTSSASDVSAPETVATTRTADTMGGPATVTFAASSVSNLARDEDDTTKEGQERGVLTK